MNISAVSAVAPLPSGASLGEGLAPEFCLAAAEHY
jgi:hypothetical protein